MSSSSHIWSVLICVEYQKFCWTLDVYLLFAIWIDPLYVFCINWWLTLLQTVVSAIHFITWWWWKRYKSFLKHTTRFMSGSSHIWSVLICVEYQNFCWTLDVYLLLAIWIDPLYVFCINWWYDIRTDLESIL